jgi:diguanylate cyclase (GGDEF)-like protein/PAS domain S-box-containing protein
MTVAGTAGSGNPALARCLNYHANLNISGHCVDSCVGMTSPRPSDSAAEQTARFQAIFEGASVGIARIDEAGRAYEANAACQAMLGYSADELAQLTFHELIHADHLAEQLELHRELMAGHRSVYELEKRYRRKDGSIVWAQTRTSLIAGSGDEGQSAIAMIQDITERKLAELEVRSNRDRLALIVETQRDIATAGDDLDRIVELIVERAMELTDADGAMVSMVDGESLDVVAAIGIATPTLGSSRPVRESIAHHAFLARASLLIEHAETDPRINATLNARIGDRSLICVPLFQGDAPVAALNVLRRSATDRLGEEERQTLELVAVVLASAVSRAAAAKAERLQREALARFQTIYDSALLGVLTVDLEGTIVSANPAIHQLLGAGADDLVARASGDFLTPDDRELVRREFQRMFAEDRDAMRLEHRMIRLDGTVVWVDSALSLVQDPNSSGRLVVALLQDITQRKAAEAALLKQSQLNEYQALHDAMTDLPNRALFRDRVSHAVDQARRLGSSGAVLLMDLDGFKEINDSLGHAAGDEVLVELSRRLKDAMRESDTAARLGGDEFAILLTDVTAAEHLEGVVARVREALERPLVARGVSVKIRAPIGIALFPADGGTVDAVIHAADQAMYEAKRAAATHVFCGDLLPPVPPLVGATIHVRRADSAS